MDNKFDIADSTDWLDTPLSQFSALETALRCQVCKDFYDTPMITTCSHTFCSLCIRRCLASDGKCPTCRGGDDASKLRRNWTVQEVVESFKEARPKALDMATAPVAAKEEPRATKRTKKRKIEDTDMEEEEEQPRRSQRKTRSQAKQGNPSSSPHEVISIDGDTTEDEYKPGVKPRDPPEDGLVTCPMCDKRMKEEAVFSHLDRCEDEQKQERKPRIEPHTSSHFIQPQNRSSTTLTRLPQLNYSLLKEISLRKKLHELGIPTWGSRQLMSRRHTEWINLWNSNCDSTKPRTKGELLRELNAWESSQGGNAREVGIPVVMRKDFDGKGWAQSNIDQFQSLIAAARAKRAPKPEEEKGEEDAQQDVKKEPSAEPSAEQVNGTTSMDVDSQPSVNSSNLPPPESIPDDSTTAAAAPILPSSSALTNIRLKVAAANAGQTIMTAPEDPSTRHPDVSNVRLGVGACQETLPPPTPSQTSNSENMGTILSPSKTKPMFALSEDPIKDVDTEHMVQ